MRKILLLTLFSSPIFATTPIKTILAEIAKESGCKLIVTSGDRTPEHNRKVGGAKHSFHLQKGRALDFVSKGRNCSILRVARIACKHTTTIRYSGHIHIDNRTVKRCFKGRYR